MRARDEDGRDCAALEQARGADLIVKASGVGVFDELLEARVLEIRRSGRVVRVLGRGRSRHAVTRSRQPRRPVPRPDTPLRP